MAVTLNASTTAGLVQTADTSGVLALQTAGTTAVTVDASQNVGIGTSSPTNKLHVSAPANTQYGTFDAVTDVYAFTNYKVGGTTYGFIGDASGLVSGGTAGNLAVRFTGAMVFSGGANERMRINSGAPILCLAGGSTTATGTGIAFPATVSLSSDANTLDDYEEGTWTPSLGGNTTYTGRTGTYTKIGNTVRVSLEVTVNLIGTGSATTMSGFPFSPVGNDAGCISYFDTLNASVVWLTIQMQGGGNCVFAGTTAATATIVNGVSIFRNGSRIIGTAVYQTSS